MRSGRKRRAGWLVALGLILSASSAAGNRLVVLQHRVWRVGSQGQIEPFAFAYPPWYDDNLQGSTLPSPSPDGRWIAFGRQYDAYLLDVSSRQERRITKFGRAPHRRYVYVDVLIDGWSPDSSELLLAVGHGEDTSEEGDLLVPKAPFGFYVYNLTAGTTKPVALPKTFEYRAWLPDGRILGVVPARVPGEGERLVTLRPGDARVVPVRVPIGALSHVQVSEDGKWMVGLLVGKRQPHKTARIVKINLGTMSITLLASLGSWTGNERPAVSPHGEHFSYVRMTQMVKGIPQEEIIVGERTLYSCPGPIDYRWVSGHTIALSCRNEVEVLDAPSGRALSSYGR
ncbi:MAG: TolB family protein [Terriglobia bacterium]